MLAPVAPTVASVAPTPAPVARPAIAPVVAPTPAPFPASVAPVAYRAYLSLVSEPRKICGLRFLVFVGAIGPSLSLLT